MRPIANAQALAQKATTKAATMARIQAEMDESNKVDALVDLLVNQYDVAHLLKALQRAALTVDNLTGAGPMPSHALVMQYGSKAKLLTPEEAFTQLIAALRYEHYRPANSMLTTTKI